MDLGGPDARRPIVGRRLPRAARWALTIAVLASASLVAIRSDLAGSLATVRHLDVWMLSVAAAATVAAVLNRGFLHHQSRALQGVECSLVTEIRLSAASLALNKVVKSGGLAGLGVYLRRGKLDGASASGVTRAYVSVGAAAHVALAGLAASVVILIPRDDLPIAGALSDVVVGSVGLAAFGVVAGVFVATIITAVSDHGFARRSRGAARVVLHAGTNKLLGVITFAAVLAAAGASVDVKTAVLVYATALVGGALSIIPAGLGVVEASTVAVLTASGVEPGSAVVAVLAFRLFDLWIPVAIGWVLARRLDDSADADITNDVALDVGPMAVSSSVTP